MMLSICDVPDVLKVFRIIKIVITIIKIIVPILLILSLMIDFTRATVSNDNDMLVKTYKLSGNKAIALVLVFMIPTFVDVITNVVAPGFDFSSCLNNATEEGINATYERITSNLIEKAKANPNNTSYTMARDYLVYIEDEGLKEKYTKELTSLKELLDEEEKKKKEEKEGRQQSNNTSLSSLIDPTVPYVPGSLKDPSFLQTAKNIWDYMVMGNIQFVYNNGNAIPIRNNLCDCSSYVSWVIYEYGYQDWAGYQRDTGALYSTNYNQLYGWEEIYYPGNTDLTPLVRPGDIIVRRANGVGHTDIVSYTDGTTVKAFDCGSNEALTNHKYPDGYINPGFLKDIGKFRPAKIIRVK